MKLCIKGSLRYNVYSDILGIRRYPFWIAFCDYLYVQMNIDLVGCNNEPDPIVSLLFNNDEIE